jgi:hypothetical protein
MAKGKPFVGDLRQGDRVQVGYDAKAIGIFDRYCVGQRSHCVIKMDDGSGYRKAKAENVFVLERRL